MIGLFVLVAAWYFHRFWTVEDETQKTVQEYLCRRDVLALGASIALFGCFAAFGPELRFTVTAPLFPF